MDVVLTCSCSTTGALLDDISITNLPLLACVCPALVCALTLFKVVLTKEWSVVRFAVKLLVFGIVQSVSISRNTLYNTKYLFKIYLGYGCKFKFLFWLVCYAFPLQKFHMISNVWFHVKSCEIVWSYVKFHTWSHFTCIHMWVWNMWSHSICIHMWSFTCEIISHQITQWSFTSRSWMRIKNFICWSSHVPLVQMFHVRAEIAQVVTRVTRPI